MIMSSMFHLFQVVRASDGGVRRLQGNVRRGRGGHASHVLELLLLLKGCREVIGRVRRRETMVGWMTSASGSNGGGDMVADQLK